MEIQRFIPILRDATLFKDSKIANRKLYIVNRKFLCGRVTAIEI